MWCTDKLPEARQDPRCSAAMTTPRQIVCCIRSAVVGHDACSTEGPHSRKRPGLQEPGLQLQAAPDQDPSTCIQRRCVHAHRSSVKPRGPVLGTGLQATVCCCAGSRGGTPFGGTCSGWLPPNGMHVHTCITKVQKICHGDSQLGLPRDASSWLCSPREDQRPWARAGGAVRPRPEGPARLGHEALRNSRSEK